MPTTALMPEGRHKYFDDNGRPLAFGKVYPFAAGTTTPKTTYTDSAGLVPHTHPIVLDAKGEATIFWSGSYKVDVKTAAGVSILGYPVDNFKTDPAGIWGIFTTLATSVGSSLIGFIQNFAGAVLRTLQDKLRDEVNLKDFGALGDGGTDNRVAIQAAIAAVSATGKILRVPAGVFVLTRGALQAAESGSVYPCLTMASNLHIRADPGAIFRLANSQSTNGAPLNIPMFFSNGVLSDISIDGLTIDMNGANNLINNINYTFAHFLFSGTPGGVAARGSNVRITNCKLINTPGATCIGMAKTETVGAVLGNNWIIRDNLFENNGLNCGDHSSIYALADDVLCTGNTFTADTMATTTGGGQVAYEFHGANQRFTDNKVKNYYQGIWMAANKTSDCDNNIVANNTFSPISDYGVAFYRETALESGINKISITGNTFGLSDRSTAAAFKAAVAITSTYPVTNVLIADNIASKVGTTEASAFCLITLQGVAVGTTHTGIKIDSNIALNMTDGVFMTTGVNGIGLVEITNNEFKDFVLAGSETQTRGIYLERLSGVSEVEEIVITGNTFSNFTGSMTYGVYLQSGVVVNLFMGSDNSFKGVTNKYVEAATITNRAGWFPIKAYTPIINIGGAVTIGNGSVDGSYVYRDGLVTAFVKYVVGSTDTIPGGNINIGVPIASINAGQIYIGQWRINDASSGNNYFDAAQIDGTGSLASFRLNGGTIATSTNPITLATGDILNLQITYKAA